MAAMRAEPRATDGWPLRHVPPQRAVAWPVIVLALATQTAAVLLMQLVVYRDADRWAPWAVEIWRATGGIVEFTLMGCLLLQVVVVGVVLMGIGRLRPIALGLDIRKVLPAVAWTFAIWLAALLLSVGVAAIAGERVALDDGWQAGKWSVTAGEWLGQILGNAPFEEILFRGFLLPQCLWLCLRWRGGASDRKSVLFALGLSQLIFALGHVPFNLVNGSGQAPMLLAQFAMGLLLCGVYLRTGNLFLAMGLHVLTNDPGPLLAGGPIMDSLPRVLVGVGMLVGVTIGPWLRKVLHPAP